MITVNVAICRCLYCFLFCKESNEDEIFKLTEELEELKITNESLQKVFLTEVVLTQSDNY